MLNNLQTRSMISKEEYYNERSEWIGDGLGEIRISWAMVLVELSTVR